MRFFNNNNVIGLKNVRTEIYGSCKESLFMVII